MRKAWLIATTMAAAVTVSGCVIYVDDNDNKHRLNHRSSDGYRVLDQNGDYSRLGGDINLRGRIGGDLSLVSGDVDADQLDVGGDVSIAAGDVNYTGTVGGDASVAGGDVDWAADVGRELSIAAGDLNVSGNISDEASLAAGDMRLTAVFLDDLTAQADQIRFDGSVEGELTLIAANRIKRNRRDDREHGLIELAGEIRNGGEICARTLVIDSDARISGSLHVWAENEPETAPGARAGNVIFEPRNGRECDDILDR
jgi:cytoskeletal protein CcmA (bactofilin family)